jgi:hypothetical protein
MLKDFGVQTSSSTFRSKNQRYSRLKSMASMSLISLGML